MVLHYLPTVTSGGKPTSQAAWQVGTGDASDMFDVGTVGGNIAGVETAITSDSDGDAAGPLETLYDSNKVEVFP